VTTEQATSNCCNAVATYPGYPDSDVCSECKEHAAFEFYTCVLCKKDFEGYGNNPIPLAKNGECCDKCNEDVIKSRIKEVHKR